MKKLLVILLISLLTLTGCTSGSKEASLSVRIAGERPLGCTRTTLEMIKDDAVVSERDIEPEERTIDLALEPGTWTVKVSCYGKDGAPHEIKTKDIKLESGAEKGVTIRLLQSKERGDRAVYIKPQLEWAEPEMEVVQALRDAQYELTLWTSTSGEAGHALDVVVDAFNALNPYGINLNVYYQGGADMLHMKTMAAVAAGNCPDIVEERAAKIDEYLPSGKVLDMRPYLADSYGLQEEDYDDIEALFLEYDSSYEDGARYSTTLGMDADVLFYNATFLDEHVLTAPENIIDVMSTARKVTKITGKPAIGFYDLDRVGLEGPVSFGADWDGSFFDGDIGPLYNFLTWWEKGVGENLFRDKGDDPSMMDAWKRGDIVFMMGPSRLAPTMNDFGFEVGVIKTPKSREKSLLVEGTSFTGFKSDDELKNLAISIALEWVYSPIAGRIFAPESGMMPATESGMAMAIKDAGDPLMKSTLMALDKTKDGAWFFTNWGLETRGRMQIYGDMLEEVLFGKKTVDEIIDEAIKASAGYEW